MSEILKILTIPSEDYILHNYIRVKAMETEEGNG